MPGRSQHPSLLVSGALPRALSGHYLQIGGDGVVHAIGIDAGRAISYRHRPVGGNLVTANLVSFGSSIFAIGDGALAHELSADLETIRGVDLAGARRALVTPARLDPHTGELHLLTFPGTSCQLHVTVSRGGLTRTIRPIDDAPTGIRQLELTRDDVVLLAEGFVGLTARAGDNARPIWFEVDTTARRVATAHADGENVIVHAAGPSLVRWTLDRRTSTARCEVLDAAPHKSPTSNRQHRVPRFLWSVGAGAAHKHDLLTGRRRSHDFGASRAPSELVFVADPDRSSTEDGGWLVGVVDDETSAHTEFVVLDAETFERAAIATVHLPRRIRNAAHGTWISS